ncbi:hypothetical protein BpHYR1_013672 [Brachionus plicatilis]|uniref:Uncharacterized protein n=1 Tax=Brachionus plicatilis TaxID=10195 RepID=A0A3M7SXJ7_BRAPC|nr:hypothetical protein BpHYR1_013672 [Brachionus plicatilis]
MFEKKALLSGQVFVFALFFEGQPGLKISCFLCVICRANLNHEQGFFLKRQINQKIDYKKNYAKDCQSQSIHVTKSYLSVLKQISEYFLVLSEINNVNFKYSHLDPTTFFRKLSVSNNKNFVNEVKEQIRGIKVLKKNWQRKTDLKKAEDRAST